MTITLIEEINIPRASYLLQNYTLNDYLSTCEDIKKGKIQYKVIMT